MNINKILDSIDNIMKNIHILIDSDKETIRSFIMSEYYKWEGKVIDLITLQNIERLYKKYLEELGDESDDFIDKIMTELRNLPTKHQREAKESNTERYQILFKVSMNEKQSENKILR